MTASDTYQRAGQLHQQGQVEDAIAAYQNAIALDDTFHPAWYSLGCAFETLGKHASALACFERAVTLVPTDGKSHHNLGKALFALGSTDEALERFRIAITLGEGFLPRTSIATIIPGSPHADNTSILAARRDWADTHLPSPDLTRRPPDHRAGERPLRVGYLSSFFAQIKWMKPVWGLVNHHDRNKVEVHLFSDAPESQCQAGYRRQPGDQFHDISSLSNQAAARQIEQSELDLLVDLNGYSRIDRLAVAALRPAPILVGWFNFYATSGMACFDYLIGDDVVIPIEEEPCYLERIVRVPGSYLSFEVSHPAPAVVDPPWLKARQMTFGCLASPHKITRPVIQAWSRILQRVSGARLFLKNPTLRWPENRQHIEARFTQCGVDPRRITMEGPAEHFDFLTAYGQVDVALDTFPYNGGTTTMEALWQGVPVVTFRGDRWASRQSASILSAAGLSEYVAGNLDGYVELAIALAQGSDSLHRLTELRRGLRDHLAVASICDTVTFARNMEALYVRMVQESAAR